jgi:hypothetical protein
MPALGERSVQAGQKALRKHTLPRKAKPAQPLWGKMAGRPKSNQLVYPLLRERRPGTEFYEAAGSPLPQVFQSTLWIGSTHEEVKGPYWDTA